MPNNNGPRYLPVTAFMWLSGGAATLVSSLIWLGMEMDARSRDIMRSSLDGEINRLDTVVAALRVEVAALRLTRGSLDRLAPEDDQITP